MTTSTEPLTAAPRLTRARGRGRLDRHERRAAWLFLSPAIAVLTVFVVWPMVTAAWTSLTNASLFGQASWVGLANYRRLLHDPRFRGALWHTFLYAVVTTPVSIVLALALALLLNQALPGRGFFRAVIFFPFVASLGIVSIAWAFLLDPQVGLVSAWLNSAGLSLGNGVRDPSWALPIVMAVGIWRNTGFFMVMFLAGLQSVPRDLKEATVIDGANGVQRFRHLTWPLISNTTMFVSVIGAIFSFQAFDQMYVMTDGGPFFRTETMVMLIYGRGFQDYEMGYAAAISWVLVAIILVLSLAQLGYFNRRVVRY